MTDDFLRMLHMEWGKILFWGAESVLFCLAKKVPKKRGPKKIYKAFSAQGGWIKHLRYCGERHFIAIQRFCAAFARITQNNVTGLSRICGADPEGRVRQSSYTSKLQRFHAIILTDSIQGQTGTVRPADCYRSVPSRLRGDGTDL
jgi:hypothetical protein